jgi:hypothetical protein
MWPYCPFNHFSRTRTYSRCPEQAGCCRRRLGRLAGWLLPPPPGQAGWLACRHHLGSSVPPGLAQSPAPVFLPAPPEPSDIFSGASGAQRLTRRGVRGRVARPVAHNGTGTPLVPLPFLRRGRAGWARRPWGSLPWPATVGGWPAGGSGSPGWGSMLGFWAAKTNSQSRNNETKRRKETKGSISYVNEVEGQ